MTRVAMVEPFFRTSGVTTYAMHLAEGFKRAGCDVDIVTFMKDRARKIRGGQTAVQNGKVQSGWQWSPYEATRHVRWSDAADALREYDLVFLNEPRCAPVDKEAMRKLGDGDIKKGRQRVADYDLEYADVPAYIRALSESETPWATCMHDPGYNQKLAPFLPQLMELAPPALVVTHRPGSIESGQWALDAAGVSSSLQHLQTPHLPFAFEPAKRMGWPRVAGMLGRYINNKGQPTLVAVAALGMMPETWEVCIDGASPLGAGPNHTYLTYEALRDTYHFTGTREGNGNVTTGDPWRYIGLAQYRGPYDDPIEASLRHGIHVNATEVGFSGPGSLEYADLEGLASGAVLVVPTHRNVTGAFEAVTYELTKCANAELKPIDAERQATLEALSSALLKGAYIAESAPLARASMERNFAAAQEHSDPRRYAERILERAL